MAPNRATHHKYAIIGIKANQHTHIMNPLHWGIKVRFSGVTLTISIHMCWTVGKDRVNNAIVVIRFKIQVHRFPNFTKEN